MSFPTLRKVEVEWIDSATSGGWTDVDNYRDKQAWLCRSSGYLLVKDSEKVIVLQTTSVTGSATDAITIPRSCVKRMRYVTGGLS